MRPAKIFLYALSPVVIALLAAGCGIDRNALCVDNVLCVQGYQWDGHLCQCVPSPPGSGGSSAGTGGSATGSGGSTGSGGGGVTGSGGSGVGGKGGAPGTCPALGCAPKCDHGVKPDANGCPTCQCNPAPVCGPVCAIFCQYGNVNDANGCPTCTCNPPPTGPCGTVECGPAPGAPSRTCPDGEIVAGPVCLRDAAGACGWHITECPAVPKTCDWNQCPAPAPGAANYLCADGKTVAGPACVTDANGACGWTFVSCPPRCVDNVLCINGYQWDGNLCKCVPSPAPPDKCACTGGQLCVQQIGGPAIEIYPPPAPLCEAPDAACAASSKDPCQCLSAGDGKCIADTTSARTCVCDNGIR